MNKNRFAITMMAMGAFILLCPMPKAAVAQRPLSHPAQSHGVAQRNDAASQDDFAGLDFTDEQKAEIEKIHRDTEMKKSVVANAQSLDAGQKNAMLQGYTRLEYGQKFNVLTPEQKKIILQRIQARKTAAQAAGKQQRPPS